MKSVLAALLAALFISFVSRSEAAAPDSRELDRQQITALIASLDETWNRHDMAAHAALFHDDGIWVAWTGQVLTGRAEYEATLTDLHKTVFKKSVHTGHIEEVTFISADAAVVRGFGTVIGNEPTPDKMERYRNLLVVAKRNGAWKVSWGQKTRFSEKTPDPKPADVTSTRPAAAPLPLFAVEVRVGPKWDASKAPQEQNLFREHSANLKRLRDAGHLVMGARYSDIGLIILAAETEASARAMIDADPSMAAGTFKYDIHPFNVFYRML